MVARHAGSGLKPHRIKATQLDLFGARASSSRFLAHWLRVRSEGLAHTLMWRLSAMALSGTELARTSAATIRVKRFKIAAVAIRNTRRAAFGAPWLAATAPRS
ncbi:MAG: transposase [Porticoccaceae bacterium]